MKREDIVPAWSPYSRKKIRRQRLQHTMISILGCCIAVAGAIAGAYVFIMELHSSLQIAL